MNTYIYISGGGSGIGLKIAELCVQKKWVPVILGRNLEKLKAASRRLNDCPYLSVDLSTEDSKKLILEHHQTLPKGNLLALVNNAGVYKPSRFLESSTKDWLDQFNINLMSAVYLSQALHNELKASEGTILNISSTLGIRSIPNTSAYSASKAAMNSLTQSLALEFANDGIRVNAICPGIVDTPIHSEAKNQTESWKEDVKDFQPLGRIGEPLDIAQTALHLIKESNWTTGSIINIDGGILLKS